MTGSFINWYERLCALMPKNPSQGQVEMLLLSNVRFVISVYDETKGWLFRLAEF
jgi:hypothetical protein